MIKNDKIDPLKDNYLKKLFRDLHSLKETDFYLREDTF